VDLTKASDASDLGTDEYPLSSSASATNSEDDSGSYDNLSDPLLLSTQRSTNKCKRKDPEPFSTAIPKILSLHFPTTAGKDPVFIGTMTPPWRSACEGSRRRFVE